MVFVFIMLLTLWIEALIKFRSRAFSSVFPICSFVPLLLGFTGTISYSIKVLGWFRSGGCGPTNWLALVAGFEEALYPLYLGLCMTSFFVFLILLLSLLRRCLEVPEPHD